MQSAGQQREESAAVVELSGTVALEEHFGPPGFGEDPKTDAVELIAVLVPDAPVSVEGDQPGEGFNETTYTDVRRLQLVRGYSDPPFSPYAGKASPVLCMRDLPGTITPMSCSGLKA
jgi:hypothetical protein